MRAREPGRGSDQFGAAGPDIDLRMPVGTIGHDAETKTLTVRFHNGTEYAYRNVEADIFVKILAAPSVGSAFHALVKSKPDEFPYRRVQ